MNSFEFEVFNGSDFVMFILLISSMTAVNNLELLLMLLTLTNGDAALVAFKTGFNIMFVRGCLMLTWCDTVDAKRLAIFGTNLNILRITSSTVGVSKKLTIKWHTYNFNILTSSITEIGYWYIAFICDVKETGSPEQVWIDYDNLYNFCPESVLLCYAPCWSQ